MLVFENVTIKRGEKVIIDSVDLKVESGEIVRICGDVGSGKSTLLRCAVGEERYSGRVEIDGADLKSRAARNATSHLCDPFADDRMIERITVKEYFRMIRLLRSADEELIERAEKILIGLGFAGGINLEIGELSGVERRKVAIAAALARETKLMLLDRPLLGMTADEAEEIIADILALKSKGSAILIATTEANEFPESLVSREMVIKNGRLSVVEAEAEAVMEADDEIKDAEPITETKQEEVANEAPEAAEEVPEVSESDDESSAPIENEEAESNI